ncbi:PucR family transcriptional regulator [Nocardioides terrisoli]|uniref:PucR family transcriptional regulator n=1 Tax=Nocardioides terrisoli TaxID=3388267 RepID=UPI00287BC26A|nr:helix-turn-helix domain-containing protein [Nocardioides marmorisolisilvae]
MTVTSQARGELETALLARLPRLLIDVRIGLQDLWPDYADFLESDHDGVEEAAALFVRRFLEISEPDDPAARPRPGDETLHLVFEQVGRRQHQLGNDLTRLLTAFQVGSRVAWRHVSAVALDAALPPESLASLADAVFVFVNKLSMASARGYVLEQIDDARANERNREELAALLLSGRAGLSAVRSAATRAGWRIPETAAVVLIDPDDSAARKVLDRLGPGTLPIRTSELYGAIVPDASGHAGRAQLVRQLQGAGAVVGSDVPLPKLPRSTEVAQVAFRLVRAGVLHGDPVFADEHLDSIIVWRDEGLLRALRRRALAPLDDLTEGARERLLETLSCWLRLQGDRHAMAEELSIHPQTVRYRLGQLHDLFGEQLDDPVSRSRLFLALQWSDNGTDD